MGRERTERGRWSERKETVGQQELQWDMITALREEVQSLKRKLESQGDGNDTWKAMVQNCICSARSQLALQKGTASDLILALFQESLKDFPAFKAMVKLSHLKSFAICFYARSTSSARTCCGIKLSLAWSRTAIRPMKV